MTPRYWQCTRRGGVRGTMVRQALNKNPVSMCHTGCKDKEGEKLGEWETVMGILFQVYFSTQVD